MSIAGVSLVLNVLLVVIIYFLYEAYKKRRANEVGLEAQLEMSEKARSNLYKVLSTTLNDAYNQLLPQCSLITKEHDVFDPANESDDYVNLLKLRNRLIAFIRYLEGSIRVNTTIEVDPVYVDKIDMEEVNSHFASLNAEGAEYPHFLQDSK